MLRNLQINIRQTFLNLSPICVLLISALISAVAITPSYADDTEVFFGQNEGAFQTNPNVLFVLDVSGSMRNKDGGTISRLDRMKSAMRTLLDQSNGFNVGVMTFQGERGGGAVRYPVGDLDAIPADICENGVCPDELIRVYPVENTDDAYQNTNSLVVTVDDDKLVMGSVSLNTDGSINTNAQTNIGSLDGNITQITRVLDSSVAEINNVDPSTNPVSWRNNQVSDTWFYENDTSENSWFGYQFRELNISPGVNIISAEIVFQTTDIANQAGQVSARITAEKTATPELLPSNQTDNVTSTLVERADDGARTNAVVFWNDIPGTAIPDTDVPATDTPDPENSPPANDKELTTPDLKEVVQELVDLPSWDLTSSMSFIITPTDDYILQSDNVREINSGGVVSSLKPTLIIRYEAEASTIETTTSMSITHIDEYINENEYVIGGLTGVYQNKSNPVSSLFHAGAGLEPRRLALRFPDIDIPKNSTISTAHLRLKTRRSNVELDPESNWTALNGDEPDSLPVEETPEADNPEESQTGTTASETPIVINIDAELSANPENDTTTPLRDRDLTGDFIPWSDIPDANNAVLDSPDIATAIKSIIDLETWVEGNTISLVLSTDGLYTDLPSNVRNILTSTSGDQPVLDITWERIIEAEEEELVRHTSAVRFRNVHVPPGATIKGARLVMHASSPNSNPENFDISGEKIANSAAFSTDSNDIGGRQKTTARTTWPMDPWVNFDDEYRSVEINDIVTEITGQSDWCGGNPLTLFIDGAENGTASRIAQSTEQNTTKAPTLEIEYTPGSGVTGSFCSNSSQTISAADGADDAVENTVTGAMDLTNGYLSTNRGDDSTDSHAIGLRFRGVQLPSDAIITSATIGVTAELDMTDSINATIAVESTSNSNPYQTSSTTGTIQGRTYGSSVNWQNDRDVAAGDNLFTTDVTSLLNETISRSGWISGNAIAFKLTSESGQLDIVSYEGNDAASPRLIVYFQTQIENTQTQNRLNIQRTVDDTVHTGATPTVESLYEASSYFAGKDVEYGRFRGTDSLSGQFFRLSHPDSYSGGFVSRPFRCYEFDLNSSACRSERILTSPTIPKYTSPIDSECQGNHIVLLSDGNATSNNAVARIQTRIGGNCASTDNGDDQCGAELASWLANTDQISTLDGDQTINTHTIAFNLKEDFNSLQARASLEAMATAGGGFFEPADSASELLLAFKRIFNNVSKRNASFVAPAASVSQFNRLRNSTDVFYGMFKPSGSARWPGNLKKYKIGVDSENEFTLLDANGNPAVDASNGNFSTNTRSFWSSGFDGDNVDEGGASEQISEAHNSYLDRNVYTYTGTSTNLTDASNEFSSTNSLIENGLFSLPSAIAADAEQVTNLIDWSAGRDIFDENGDGNTDDVRAHMGDPMHATPLVASYASGESVIYMATNEGFLHAIDADDGSEHFTFIPKELFRNLYKFFRNEATQNRIYGLDGGKTLWHEDTNDDGLIDSTETAILYIAMRRGGDSYYALDISNYLQPKYLWSIKGGVLTSDQDSTTADGNYQKLASTWSLPVKTKIVNGSDVVDVIVFGGGYDPNQDPSDASVTVQSTDDSNAPDEPLQSRTPDSIGAAIFIADAQTGELIWKTSSADTRFSDMEYSIPSQVRSIDINFDGITDQLYVGDMGGQVWRMDFNNNLLDTDSIDSRISAGRIAELAGDTPKSNRRFYYPPDISVVSVEGEQLLSIAIGSGWRAHPLDELIEDRLYSLRSPYVFGPPIDSFGELIYDTVTETTEGMIDVTTDIATEVGADARGWYLKLGADGEKIVSSSLTFNGQLAVTTYSPSQDSSSCNASLGTGRIYAVDVKNGAPVLNLDGLGLDDELTLTDRGRVLAASGIPPEVSVLFPDIESNKKPFFQVGKETIEEIDGGDSRKITFWQEVTEGHDE